MCTCMAHTPLVWERMHPAHVPLYSTNNRSQAKASGSTTNDRHILGQATMKHWSTVRGHIGTNYKAIYDTMDIHCSSPALQMLGSLVP